MPCRVNPENEAAVRWVRVAIMLDRSPRRAYSGPRERGER